MTDLTDFIKAIVRPIIILSSWLTLLFMWVYEIEVPDLLLAAGTAIVGEYVVERAVKRFKENK